MDKTQEEVIEELRDKVSAAYEHGRITGESKVYKEILYRLLKIEDEPILFDG